jgi:uncharacterized membrane protein
MDMYTNAPETIEPQLELVASYDNYYDAQRAIDRLADARFPVERLKLVGEGLTYVENVIGRRSFGRAAAEGAVFGALVTAFIGLLFGLFSWYDPLLSGLALGFWGLLFGAAAGALFGALAHATSGGKRDFASFPSMRADRFELLAEAGVAEGARMELASSRGG